MKKIKSIMLIAMLTAIGASAQTTNYVETFDPVAPTNVINYRITLGGNYAMGVNSNLSTIVDDYGIWGFTSNASIQAIGGANGNVLQPQLDGKNNARLAGVFIDPTNFNGLAGSYALSFDIVGADPGAGRVYVGQGSGYDLSGSTTNALELYLTAGGFGGYVGLTALGTASAETLVSAELDEQTSTNLTFTFNYDGSSALAIAFGGYNTGMQIDNIVISSTNIAPPLVGASDVVMFGGLANVLTGDVGANNAFVTQIGAGEIVQWNGVNSDGGSFGASGTLINEGVGASLTNSANNVILTTTMISSSNAARTNTVSSGGQLGVNFSGSGDASFQQSDATEWSFEFSKRVELKQMIFAGLDAALKDRMRITVDSVDYDLSPADTDETDSWSGAANTEVYTFPTPVDVLAGTEITISTHADQGVIDPPLNKWGLFAVVVTVPQQTAAELYNEWLAPYAAGMGSQTNLTDNPDNDALNNLYEYAQGGDPTNSADIGNQSVFAVAQAGGTNYFDYVYFKRTDAAERGLLYEVQLDDDLVYAPGWTNVGYEVVDGTVSGGFQAITNRVPTDGKTQQFINLNIELQ